eukprot:6178331-Pleurochrysis_carterae.AAC.1
MRLRLIPQALLCSPIIVPCTSNALSACCMDACVCQTRQAWPAYARWAGACLLCPRHRHRTLRSAST